MGYTIQRLQTKVLISYSNNTIETAAVNPCLNLIASNYDERVVYVSETGSNQGLNQIAVAHFPFDDIDSCTDSNGNEYAPFFSRNECIAVLADSIFNCQSAVVPTPTPVNPTSSLPFCYFIEDNKPAVKIKSELSTLIPINSMFVFNSDYDLVPSTGVTQDAFFTRVGDDITLDDI